jgi:hypothetical protein
MYLTPTTAPEYLEVISGAREAAMILPPHLAHLLLVLATRYPEIRPPIALLAAHTHTSARTVERNLAQLSERGWVVSKTMNRGLERGGVSWRFLLLPTLTLPGEPPLLVGRGPASWEPCGLRVGGADFPSLMTADRDLHLPTLVTAGHRPTDVGDRSTDAGDADLPSWVRSP